MPTATGHTSAIRAKKVNGTKVIDRSGKEIGEIEDIVLDKLSNNIMFAVVSFGGLLGIAQRYHPVPWSSLNYDKSRDSYVVDFTKEQIEGAPAASLDELISNDGQKYRDKAFEYYKAPSYWEPSRH
jgi:sporulation protein YlmC with PRC-barrel domain